MAVKMVLSLAATSREGNAMSDDNLLGRQCGSGLTEEDVITLVGPHLELCNTIPVPDNEVDGNIRSGIAGSATTAARCDHNHPIRRQAMQPDPVIAIAGPATLTQQVINRRWSDEETIYYAHRIILSLTTANGWVSWQQPQIAGFQQVQILDLNTYRPTGNINNPGDDNFGAMPDAPYMGQEASHFNNSRRIYIAQSSQKDNPATMWVSWVAKYIRN